MFLLVLHKWNDSKFCRSGFALLVLAIQSLEIQFLKKYIKIESIYFWLLLCTSNYRICLHVVIKPEGFLFYVTVSSLLNLLCLSTQLRFYETWCSLGPGGALLPLHGLTLCWFPSQGSKIKTDLSRRGLGQILIFS